METKDPRFSLDLQADLDAATTSDERSAILAEMEYRADMAEHVRQEQIIYRKTHAYRLGLSRDGELLRAPSWIG